MKIKLISWYVLNNPQYKNLIDLSSSINKKYCQLNNYQYYIEQVSKQTIENKFGEINQLKIFSYVYYFIYEQLMKSNDDYLVFLDNDAVVNNPTIKIEDIIDNQHQLFLSKGNTKSDIIKIIINLSNEFITKLKNKSQFFNSSITKLLPKEAFNYGWHFMFGDKLHNEGFYIIKNTPLMKELFKQVTINLNLFLKTIKIQQASLDLLLFDDRYKDKWTFLYDQAQGHKAGSFESYYDQNKTFVMHNYAIFNCDKKIQFMKQLKKNKWWSKIYNN